jgi:predicted 3-demethylubiquinone-9 3-methyltransferase (glyoxalase superfamily)
MEPDREGTIMFTDFKLEGIWLAAMDSARQHDFTFSEAVSLIVNCKDQEEIDYYWEKLSADPKSEQCGWLKDKYGVSWQIVPEDLEEKLRDSDPEKVKRVTQAFLPMKKLIIKDLEEAYDGK